MKAAELADQSGAVDRHDGSIRERLGQTRLRHRIGRIAVDRQQHRAVDDEEVGVGCREPVTGIVVDRARKGQRDQMVGRAIGLAQRRQFPGHGLQRREVAVRGVVAALIDDGIGCCEARQGVDMAVRVVAFQMPLGKPQYALDPQGVTQLRFGGVLGDGAIAMRIQKAGGRGEQRAFAVALQGPAFEHEVHSPPRGLAEDARRVQPRNDGVVECTGIFAAPGIEREIEQHGLPVLEDRERPVVADPGIVARHDDEVQAFCLIGQRRNARAHRFHKIGVVHTDYQCFPDQDGAGDGGEGALGCCEVGCPVGFGVRPGQQDSGLGFPFGGKMTRGLRHDGRFRMTVDRGESRA